MARASYRGSSSSQYSQHRMVKAKVAEKLKHIKKVSKAKQLPLLQPRQRIVPAARVPIKPREILAPLRNGLQQDSEGFYAKFTSKSNPSAPPYTARIWTTRSGRFGPGDVSCNCRGWIFNKNCHHCEDIVGMYRETHPGDNSVFKSNGLQL